MIHRNLLLFRGARYLWWSLGLLLISGVLYATQGTVQPPNGGTWQGYVLGSIGALLIVWLTLLGVRKRSYSSTMGSVQGWTSAHVYLGTALLIIATLHAGFQVGWNLHTLAYVLMCVVIASGFFGLYSYLNHPQLISKNREGGSRAELFAELFELDKQSRSLAQKCAPEVGDRSRQQHRAHDAGRRRVLRSCSVATTRSSCAARERRCATPTSRPSSISSPSGCRARRRAPRQRICSS